MDTSDIILIVESQKELKAQILEAIKKFERDMNCSVLYAAEIGLHSYSIPDELARTYFPERYNRHNIQVIYKINGKREKITTQNSTILVSGWDEEKFNSMVKMSMPTVIECMHSKIIYKQDSSFKKPDIKMDKQSILNHYSRMAKVMNGRLQENSERVLFNLFVSLALKTELHRTDEFSINLSNSNKRLTDEYCGTYEDHASSDQKFTYQCKQSKCNPESHHFLKIVKLIMKDLYNLKLK